MRNSVLPVDKEPQFESRRSTSRCHLTKRREDERNKRKLEILRIGSCTDNDLSKGNMIFSEESRRATYEMGNLELIGLRQTSATIQRPSCLKHVPEGLNMCLCGVWLRPNQSTRHRIRVAFAALKTPYYRTAITLSSGKKSGHNQWQMDHLKAMDAKRGATQRRDDTSVLSRWQNDEIYRASHLAHGWTETYVKYLDCISQIDISREAPHRQQHRCESTLYMRGVDSNLQAEALLSAFNEIKENMYLQFRYT